MAQVVRTEDGLVTKTEEPDDSILEMAIAAIKQVITEEIGSDRW